MEHVCVIELHITSCLLSKLKRKNKREKRKRVLLFYAALTLVSLMYVACAVKTDIAIVKPTSFTVTLPGENVAVPAMYTAMVLPDARVKGPVTCKKSPELAMGAVTVVLIGPAGTSLADWLTYVKSSIVFGMK